MQYLDAAYKAFTDFRLAAEPLVVALFFCGILALGFILGSGIKSAKRKFHSKREAASSKDLLE